MMGFQMAEVSEQTGSVGSEARSFNPDQRVEVERSNDSSTESFDPDKRLLDVNDSTESQDNVKRAENLETSIEEAVADYVKELKEFSEVPDTIPDKPFEASELTRLSTEEVCARREEFSNNKAVLRSQWEEANGCGWPRYAKDVKNALGVVVRKAGTCYDMHHIKPLCLGGKNEVGNITPLSYDRHLTKEGIHRQDGTCDRMTKRVEERQQ